MPVSYGVAESVVLHPVADATLFEVAPNNSAGGAGFFNAGTTQNRTRNRALLQFDVSSALPPGAVISAAGLQLEVVRRSKDGYEISVFGLHRVLEPWGEGQTVPTDNGGGLGAPAAPGDATWNNRFAFTPEVWASPGGAPGMDFAEDFSSSTLIYDVGTYQFESTLGLVRDVQSWLDNPQANFGWMLLTESEDLPFTARRFASREDPGGGPVLMLEYTVVPEPGAFALTALGVVALAALHRVRL